MYNGIGLSTARGSGTSGYVQRNLAHTKGKGKRTDLKVGRLLFCGSFMISGGQTIATSRKCSEVGQHCGTVKLKGHVAL